MTETAVLKVLGMTCGHCELDVQESLDGLDGVESAEADRATGDVEVAYYEGEVSAEQFREAIEDAGYALVGAEKG
jgi:copper chaperone